MYTHCPHCHTTFRIHAEQLRAAYGQVRCSQCQQVFNALENFAETKGDTESWPESRFIRKIDYEQDTAEFEQATLEAHAEAATDAAEPSDAPDLLTELTDPYRGFHLPNEAPAEETGFTIDSEDETPPTEGEAPTQPTVDTRFSDYLAELENKVNQLTQGVDSNHLADISFSDAQKAFFDSLDIDENQPLDLPILQDPNPAGVTNENQKPQDSDDETPDEADEEERFEWPFIEGPDSEERAISTENLDSDEPDEDENESPFIEITPPESRHGEDDHDDFDIVEESADRIEPAWTDEASEPDPLPFRLAENVPDIKPSDQEPLTLDELLTGKTKRRKKRILLSLLVLLLLLAAGAQMAWLYRERLMEIPLTKAYLNQFCALVDCKLPVKRAPEKFEVISRSLVIAPDKPGILQLNLSFTNTANFPQPYPGLRLNLYAGDEKLLARRGFRAEEYMGRPVSDHSLIKPRETIVITMSLEEPDDQVSGFRFEFE